MAAHLGESSVEPSLTADQQRVHSRTHVVVDAALTGTFVKREGFVVRVEHHLLRLPRIGTHERHSAVTQPNLGDLHNGGRAVQDHDLGRPIELVGLARRVAQRNIGIG